MNANASTFATILQYLYYLATYLIAFGAIYGLRQLRIMKKDFAIRNERSAKEKAIEFSNEYLINYVELSTKHYNDEQKNKIQSYKGPIGDFTPDSISNEYKANLLKRLSCLSCLNVLNKLESISAAFVTGVADETTGFKIIGRSYTATVSSLYDIISALRNEKASPYFNNIVELYKVWSPRLTKYELENERNNLDSRMANIQANCIKPIGTED